MVRPIIKEHNATTNEIIEREMNDTEFAKFQADQAEYNAAITEAEAKVIARQAVLDRLGLSADEAALLLG